MDIVEIKQLMAAKPCENCGTTHKIIPLFAESNKNYFLVTCPKCGAYPRIAIIEDFEE